MLVSIGQSANVYSYNVVCLDNTSGIFVIAVREWQPKNDNLPMNVMLSGILIVPNEKHASKVQPPNDITLSAIVIAERDSQCLNALILIAIVQSPIHASVRFLSTSSSSIPLPLTPSIS